MAVGGAFLSATLQVAFDRLATPIIKKFGSLLGVQKDLKKLSRTLSKIQAVLSDAEQKQISNPSVQEWLTDLKDVAYDIEDLFDEVDFQAHQFEQEKQVSNSLIFPKEIVSKFGFASKIKEINEKLDDIAKDKDDLELKERVGSRFILTTELPLKTSSLIDEKQVFGRKDDRDKIVESLVSDDCSANSEFSVIPIVGMGGLGKTTLAQMVYNHERVEKHFSELRMWICVSINFDLVGITKSIIESATKMPCDLMELDVLQKKLQETLKGKRFLLVLDDVWNVQKHEWEMVSLPFKVGAKGSKIIVTTRILEVSTTMDTTPYPLEYLSEEDCWLLFKQRAFVGGNSDAYPNLVGIGKEILKKCKGLPLAAKTLGGLLYAEDDEDKWRMILESDIWEVDENKILPALRLSYNHLPAHLRQCFAYCSIFPKDYEFEKENLVLMWIAAGFVDSKGKKTMEDIGREYFNDLLWRSFFQHSKIDEKRFVMHDLIHDLAQVVSGDACFTMEGDNSCTISERTRHASFLLHTFKSITAETFPPSRSRTFLLLSGNRTHETPTLQVALNCIENLKFLRTLDLSRVAVIELPDTIGNLKHLRYLNLSQTDIKRLPESTSCLYNLQTLILMNCNKLLELPRESRNLVNLRHLDLVGCWRLVSMPHGVGRLTCLQTLNRFVTSRENGCGIEELKDMLHIRGALKIERLEDVIDVTKAREANLKNKLHLHKLSLEWSSRSCSPDVIDETVLEGLQPYTNLKELKIASYHGDKFPNWVGDSAFSRIVNIKLLNCNRCQILPPLGQLPILKDLTIDSMNGLEYVGREFSGDGNVRGFPRLESLRFEEMKDLKGWNEVEDGEFPCLHKLTIVKCPKMATLPKFPSLSNLVLNECHEMILSSVPYLTSLTSLKICNFRKLASLPKGLLRPLHSLEELRIQHCYRLTELQREVGLQNLVSLHHLDISCCPKLTSFQENVLPTELQNFSISVCGNLKSLPNGLHELSSLEELDISKCPQLVSFPDKGLPTGLKCLKISACVNLCSLPVGLQGLTSLKDLRIESCHKLESLPEGRLPAQLRSLQIRKCDLLEKRCQQGGEDWSKISHITELSIDKF